MAQIREFESTTESYFILDGVNYPKVYEAMLDNGYSDTKIKLVGTNRDTTPLVFSTQYTNIRVDGDSFDTALEAISRLNQIVFSKGGGSGTGGATNVITEDSDTVAFTGNGTALEPLVAEVKSDGLDFIPLGGTIEGKPITGNLIFKIEDTKDGESIENIGGIYYTDQKSVSVGVANIELGTETGISSYYNAIEIFKTVAGVSKMSFMFSDSGITLYDRLSQKGLVAEAYYGANYDDNTYVQKKYVDDPETLITVLNNANSTQLATIKGLLGIV